MEHKLSTLAFTACMLRVFVFSEHNIGGASQQQSGHAINAREVHEEREARKTSLQVDDTTGVEFPSILSNFSILKSTKHHSNEHEGENCLTRNMIVHQMAMITLTGSSKRSNRQASM